MYKIRLGLISEAAYPSQSSLLPYDAIEMAFRDVDGILHTGETPSDSMLDNLSGIAPTQTVAGYHLSTGKRIFDFGDVRIGLTHGHRHPLLEGYFAFQRKMGNIYAGGRHLLDTLPVRFADDDVDAVVFGHLNIPLTLERDGILLINPGAVYTISPEAAQWELLRETNPERRHLLESHIREIREHSYWYQPRSTIGILEINADNSITTTIQPLPVLTFA